MDLSEKQHHTKKCNEIRRLNLKLASMPTTQLHLLDEIQHNKPFFVQIQLLISTSLLT